MYQALYRKYRSQTFDEMVGQSVISTTLKQAVSSKKISHAYLFSGPRGTGKTSAAKIFAKAMNCPNQVNGEPCNHCDICRDITNGSLEDVIEIDAASNNGVDEIRDIRDKSTYAPSRATYKVYIIDEVHMLSIGAFNALLKTLEEPPEHAIFILATTDPQKVPETIISRCQCFSFKKISSSIIKNRLLKVCSDEKIDIDSKVLDSISLLSEGGMRDALGMLDKLVSYAGNKITYSDYVDVNGIISDDELQKFLYEIFSGNISKVLFYINEFDNSGKNLFQIVSQMLNYCRNLLVDYYISNVEIAYNLDNFYCFINLLNENMFDIKKSSNMRIYFEIFLLKFINDYVLKNESEGLKISNKGMPDVDKHIDSNTIDIISNKKNNDEKVRTIDNKNINSNIVNSISDTKKNNKKSNAISEENVSSVPKILNISEIMSVRVHNILAAASKSLLKSEMKKFDLLNDYTFDQQNGYIVCNLLDSKLRAVSDDAIIISFEYESNVEQNLLLLEKIEKVYNDITSSNKKFAIISDLEWEKAKNEYINNLKNKIKYEILDEPEIILEKLNNDSNNDILLNSAVDLFGDIVEIE